MQKSTATPSIFVLIHKIDKLTEGERDPRLKAKQLQIEQIAARCGLSVKRYFYTSIFN